MSVCLSVGRFVCLVVCLSMSVRVGRLLSCRSVPSSQTCAWSMASPAVSTAAPKASISPDRVRAAASEPAFSSMMDKSSAHCGKHSATTTSAARRGCAPLVAAARSWTSPRERANSAPPTAKQRLCHRYAQRQVRARVPRQSERSADEPRSTPATERLLGGASASARTTCRRCAGALSARAHRTTHSARTPGVAGRVHSGEHFRQALGKGLGVARRDGAVGSVLRGDGEYVQQRRGHRHGSALVAAAHHLRARRWHGETLSARAKDAPSARCPRAARTRVRPARGPPGRPPTRRAPWWPAAPNFQATAGAAAGALTPPGAAPARLRRPAGTQARAAHRERVVGHAGRERRGDCRPPPPRAL